MTVRLIMWTESGPGMTVQKGYAASNPDRSELARRGRVPVPSCDHLLEEAPKLNVHMHHALRLEEILLNIFGQCYSPRPTSRQRASRATADLAALARTCRTFKEPALDVLWTELVNLAPLARCLPEASHRVYPGYAVGWFLVFAIKRRY